VVISELESVLYRKLTTESCLNSERWMKSALNTFKDHPEEIEDFLADIFADYAHDGISATSLSALWAVAPVNGLATVANKIGVIRQGLQKALSAKGNPRLDNINAIHAGDGLATDVSVFGSPSGITLFQ
jgi:probable addiction module antidote protein